MMSNTCTPPQTPTRSVKRNQSQSFTSSTRLKRGSLPFLTNSHVSKVMDNSNTSALTYSSGDSVMDQYGFKTIHKKVQKYNIPNSGIEEIKHTDFKISKTRGFSYNISLCFLMIVSGILGALFKTYFDHYYNPECVSPTLESFDIIPSNRPSQDFEMINLKNHMQMISEDLNSIKEQISNSEMKYGVIPKPSKGVLEELFPEEPDLACAGLLGSVLATPDTATVTDPTTFTVLGLSWTVKLPLRPPQTTIKGLIQEIGDCWAFTGQTGRLVLSLHRPSLLTGVAISHIPHTISPSGDILSAPRHFLVLAHREEDDFRSGILLGQFEYNSQGPWRQTFTLNPSIAKESFKTVEFQFLNNQGNPNYTCIYRVHVHGRII